jgi:CxxC-x17-CxxC domain-containing protein
MKNFTGERKEGGFGGGYKGSNGGGRPFQKKSWGNDRNSSDRPVVMHKATCNECGKTCEVPFRPTGEKPVYCNDCFNKKRDPSDSRGAKSSYDDRAPKYPQRDFNDRHAPRPEFRSEARTERPNYKPTISADETKKQLTDIGFKLDRLIAAMEKMTKPTSPVAAPVVSAPKTESKKVVVAPKVESKKAPTKVATPRVVKKVVSKAAPAKKVIAKKKK